MFPEIRIGSRWGNFLVCALGALYGVASIVLLGYYVANAWGAASLTDRGLQFCLAIAFVLSIAFVMIGRNNLRRQRQ